MAKHIATVCWAGQQMRITVPKLAVRGLKWETARYLLMEERADGTLLVRRLLNGEGLKTSSKTDKDGSD